MNYFALGFMLVLGGLAQLAGVLYWGDTVDGGIEAAAYASGYVVAIVLSTTVTIAGVAVSIAALFAPRKRRVK